MVMSVDQLDRLIQMQGDAFDESTEAVRVGDIVNDNLAETFPAAISEISHRNPETGEVIQGTGFEWRFETRTGEPRRIHRNNLRAADRKRHKDPNYPEWIGKPVFSRTPTKPFVLGTSLCWLHPQHPDKWVQKIPGIHPCMSAHLANEYEAERHTRLRHRSEFAAIQGRQEAEERQRDRALQERGIRAQEEMARALEGAGVAPRPRRPRKGKP